MDNFWQQNLRTINNIPEQRIGDFEIIKVNNETFLIEHYDYIKVWMAGSNEERQLYLPLYSKCDKLINGKVLIAGLGLGLDLLNVISNPNVKEIVLIEKQKEIIDLVWPYVLHDKTKLIHKDIFEFLRTTDEQFDLIYFDIFPGGRMSFPEEADKLEKLARQRLRLCGEIVFWEEETDVSREN